MSNSTASDIIVSPAKVWIAAERTALITANLIKPDLSSVSPWKLLNTNGQADIVSPTKLTIDKKTFDVMSEGLMVQRGIFATDMSIMLEVESFDLSMAAWAFANNSNTATSVSAVSGTVGYQTMELLQNFQPTKYALCCDVPSPTDPTNAALMMRFYFTRMAQISAQPIEFSKSKPASMKYTFKAVYDNQATGAAGQPMFGRLVILTDAALP